MANAFPQYLPPVGGVLIFPAAVNGVGSTSNYGALDFENSGDYSCGGTIYATNSLSVAAGNIRLYGTSVSLSGGATVYANGIALTRDAKSTWNFDLSRLNLGIGGIRRTSTTNTKKQALNFLDGIAFGAWGGDVPAETNLYLTVNLEGPVEYDTQDCFDPSVSRTINMARAKMDGVTDFKACGGGTVVLSADTGAETFRAIEVADGTTLELTNAVAYLKAMSLKLGAAATIRLDLSAGGCLDAAATAEFGEGSKIVVTALPATLTSGTFYPVYFAPAGTDPDLSRIEYADGEWPTGWSLAKTGCAVYLTDGNISPYTGEHDGRVWSGAGSDNIYTNEDNWVDRMVATSGKSAYFGGCSNTVVYLDSQREVRRFVFLGGSGPFVFSGEDLKFNYPSSITAGLPSVANIGAFPVVLSNSLEAANAFRFHSYGQGSVALMGDSSQGVPLDFGGDVRIGGSWTSQYLRVVPKYSTDTAVRRSRLTVMPGATLTVTGQSVNFNDEGAGALAVAANASATIKGTEFLLTSNNTHYVDGSLTVKCPIVPQGLQVFRGSGTLTLEGGFADAPDGGIKIEGGLTLVPSNLVADVVLSVKGEVTIAPSANWTFGGDASIELEGHSTLTLATGGHKVTFGNPVVSDGTLAVTGGGTLELAAAGTVLGKVTCAGGSTLLPSDAILESGQFADVLSVRNDDESVSFDQGFFVRKRFDLETGLVVYSAKRKSGMFITIR